ncbi:uncharacterized protein LOC128736816 [Sabethes cyaneus]|uniref:uncharacterized protein LOC128736816 n=1 Tax=Sabethes cyaneus TaxID=53552 RepID=UPI00237D5A6D|nr:uncharacterized protein LOC128736816 [Sabethes cyaneus]
MEECKQRIHSSVNIEDSKTFIFTQEMAYQKCLQRKTHCTEKKARQIISELENKVSNTPTYNENAIYNATKQQLPPDTKILLSLGPKFTLPHITISQLPIYHLIADVESIIRSNPDKTTQNQTRCLVANTIQNHIHDMKSRRQNDLLTRFCTTAVKTTRNFIKENPTIRVMPADKGNRTVIMDIDDYKTKMNELLLDTNTYKQITRDPTSRYQTMNNRIVQRLYDLKLVDKNEYYSLKTNTATCPRIYGQPKAHKPNLPLRPVIPNMTAPSYALSKYICKILQASIKSNYSVTDSFAFCRFINSNTLPQNYEMISLDVISLFTNIPQELVTKGIIDHWQHIRSNTNICLDIFLEMVNFCMDCSYFQFDNKYYHQIKGTAMGNPLSPILAEIVIDTLIDTVMSTIHISIPAVKKYVDDLLLTVPHGKMSEVLNLFNSYHPMLQFTAEAEKDCQLPYLDMLLIRKNDQTIQTQWYTKSISSGRLINYHSFHPLSQKMNTAINFITRVDRLSTNYTNAEKYSIIQSHLKRNDYPIKLINRCWNRYVNQSNLSSEKPPPPSPPPPPPPPPPQPPNTPCKSSNTTTSNQQPAMHRPSPTQTASSPEDRESQIPSNQQPFLVTQPTQLYRSIPHIADLSPRIAKILKRELGDIKIAYSNTNNLSALLPPIKDTLPTLMQHNVIYSTKCREYSNGENS